MMIKAMIVWVLGLCTLVPYAIYYLFTQATRDEYALWIILPLFWIFGFWGVVGPMLAALKVRSVFKTIETARSPEELRATLSSVETQDAVIDLIASENRIPRFLAARVYRMLVKHLVDAPDGQRAASPP